MTNAELDDIEAGIDPAIIPFRVRDDLRTLVAEVRRLREALEEITRLGTGHSLDSALVVARAALRPARD
jgi:hypothetical protein